jgi:hypothetical protein
MVAVIMVMVESTVVCFLGGWFSKWTHVQFSLGVGAGNACG